MNKLTQICNAIYDFFYESWYGYRRAKAEEQMIKPGEIPVCHTCASIPEYLKPVPLVANCTPPIYNREFSEALSISNNQANVIDFETLNIEFPITGKVWVYNVSKLTHEVDHPTLGRVKIPGNTSRKRYSMWTSFPNVVRIPDQTFGDNGEILATVRAMDGKRFAMDLINPDNLGLDQSKETPKYGLSMGRNLGVRGVFWSEHNPPKKTEVDAAEGRMAKHYTDLLQRAAVLFENARFDERKIKAYMEKFSCDMDTAISNLRIEAIKAEISPEYHAAANYFKMTTEWHPVLGMK